jgi:hypothetical protein
MTLELGDTVWIPCDVTRGVFPDERYISVDSPAGHWVGFVNVKQLRDDIENGRTAIRATIVRSAHGEFAARLPGQTTHRQYVALTET